VIVPAHVSRRGTILDRYGTILGTGETISAVPVFEHPGQQLDRYQERERGPARDHPADRPGAGRSDVRGQACRRPGRQRGNACACHPVSPCAAASSCMWL